VSLVGTVRLRRAGAVAAAVLVVDQVTKALVQRFLSHDDPIVLGPVAALTFVWNKGAAFGVFAAAPEGVRLPLFLAVTVFAAIAMVSFLRSAREDQRWLAVGIGAILGGALGNAICRTRYGQVVDFIDLHWGSLHWPAFNVADSAITVGVAIVLIASFRDGDPDPRCSLGSGS
jgi:signal peptidase II